MKEVLYNLWFAFYGRSSKSTFTDSSGFEHVFVGEHKSGKVTGFHSWVQMYLLEKNGRLDYMGYNAKSEVRYPTTVLFVVVLPCQVGNNS